MSREDQPPLESPTIRAIAMPADTNPLGANFGGWVMSQMDLAAGSVAALISGGRSATVSVDAMIFHRPVKGATKSRFMQSWSGWAEPR